MSNPNESMKYGFVKSLKKIKNTVNSWMVAGFKGMVNMMKTKTSLSSSQIVNYLVEDLRSNKPMFRYATCNDMIWMMSKYGDYCREDRDSTKSTVWGLKSAGTLFCVDKVVRLKPKKMLEIGSGWNRHFDTHFGADHEYWAIDDASEIGWDKASLDKFEKSVGERKNTHFVRGYLGSFSKELEDNSFDLVFSISVIEHVPPEGKRDFYRDMYRVVKPGGYIAHSIDIFDETLGLAEFEIIKQTGFVLPAAPDLRVRVRASEGNPTLFEDMWTVFNGYLGINRPDKWENLVEIPGQNATIFVLAQKPLK